MASSTAAARSPPWLHATSDGRGWTPYPLTAEGRRVVVDREQQQERGRNNAKAPVRATDAHVQTAVETGTAVEEQQQKPAEIEKIDDIGTSKKSKLFRDALMTNAERQELHNEIYTYFKWLEQSIILTNSRNRASAVGMSATAIQRVLQILESELRSVRDDVVVLDSVAGDFVKNNKLPFLELHCYRELKKRVEETQDWYLDRQSRFLKTWDDRYNDLVKNKHILHTHTYDEMNAKYQGMGDWLKKQRALYTRQDENFMKERAKRLETIPNFPWVQPKIKKLRPVIRSKRPTALDKDDPTSLTPKAKKSKAANASTVTKNTAVAADVSTLANANDDEPIKAKAQKAKPSKPKQTFTQTYDFDQAFHLLVEYKLRHGHCSPPQTTPLGRWTASMRKKCIKMSNTNDDDVEISNEIDDRNDADPSEDASYHGVDANDDADSSNLANNDGIDALAAAATTTVEAVVSPKCRLVVMVPPGRLGLSVQFIKDNGSESERAEITAIYEKCSFKDKVKLGDSILMIDGQSVTTPDHLSFRMNQSRTIIIAVKSEKKELSASKTPVEKKETIEKKPEKKSPNQRPNDLLTDEQIQRLNSIGFNWERCGTFRSWELSFQDLLAYYRTHGDFRVPRTYKLAEDNFALGNWVHSQRKLYKEKKPKFTKERAPKLDAVGFEWKPLKTNFENNFKDLVAYKQKFGHVNVPCNNSTDNEYSTLGRWCATLRNSKMLLEKRKESGVPKEKCKKSDYLTVERIKLLESLGFDWVKRSKVKKGRSKKGSSSHIDPESEELPGSQIEEQAGDQMKEQLHNEVQPAYGEWA